MLRTACLIVALALLLPQAVSAQAAPKLHKIVIQVDTADPATMNLALGNAINAKKYYDTQKEPVNIEIVAYGPGIDMLRADKSPVKDRIDEAKSRHSQSGAGHVRQCQGGRGKARRP